MPEFTCRVYTTYGSFIYDGRSLIHGILIGFAIGVCAMAYGIRQITRGADVGN